MNNNFLIYKSSAGSGKTYTLVKEYLKLALSNGGDYRHILAVTFTNKAAEEMKTRVISSLVSLSEGKADNLCKELKDEGIEGDISMRAREVLRNILHRYSYFSVLTIDSFFNKIIRAFAKELKLYLGYNIEIEVDMVMDKITDELLDEIGTNKELTDYIEEFVFHRIDENKDWKIESKIKELAREIFNERYWIKKAGESGLADSREKMKDFIETLKLIVKDFERKFQAFGKEALDLISDFNLEPADFKHGSFSYFVKLTVKDNYPDNIEPGKIVRKIVDGMENWYTQKSFKKSEIINAANNGLNEKLAETISFYDNNFRHYYTAKELIKTVYVLGIYKDLMDRLRMYRDENKVMLISDLNNILMKIISGENSPFVYEKTGSFYKNFLIDEFQDTSTFQWANFLPLVLNSLSENNFSMIVGDVKQSIYRFRNGNMKLLLEQVKTDLSSFTETTEERFLQQNFRSKKNIVEFNNSFFSRAAEQVAEKLEDDEAVLVRNAYNDTEQKIVNDSDEGFVNINFIESINEEGEFEYHIGADESARQTLIAVKKALEDGFRQKDIMVLTRYIREGSEMAAYLIQNGYSVVSSESLVLTNSPKVKILVNLLKYITDSRNNLAKTELLYEYTAYISKSNPVPDFLFRDYRNSENPLFKDLLPDEFFAEGDKTKLNPAFFRLNLYELVETLIRIFGLNNSVDAYLLRFLDLITEYSTLNANDISGFIEWWSQNSEKESIAVPEKEDAIRVMTIHKAKGLQSPVVIIPFANWEMDISGDLIWASSDVPPFNESSAYLVKASKALLNTYFKEDYISESVLTNLDNLNLLYVAFTRAIDRLYINVPDKHSKTNNAGKLITNVIKFNELLVECMVSETEFRFGKLTKNNSIQTDLEGSYLAEEFLSTEYFSKTIVKPAQAGVSIEKAKKYAQLKNRGILLHKALSMIKYPGDAESAYEKLKTEGLITAENEEEFISELLEILKDSRIKSWFSDDFEIKTEAELILPDGKVYKPDRVLLKEKKAVVIDFKTGKQRKEHRTQITQYAEVLGKMGYSDIEKYLLYVPEREVVKV